MTGPTTLTRNRNTPEDFERTFGVEFRDYEAAVCRQTIVMARDRWVDIGKPDRIDVTVAPRVTAATA